MHKGHTLIDVHEWDTGKYLGRIEQARQTYNVVGNMNEFNTIGETTFGRRVGGHYRHHRLRRPDLSRSATFRTAREAIKVMMELVQEYGYYSGGELTTSPTYWPKSDYGDDSKGPGVRGAAHGWLSACPEMIAFRACQPKPCILHQS